MSKKERQSVFFSGLDVNKRNLKGGDTMEIRFVPYLLIMLAILSGLIKLLDWHDERLDTKCANLMHKDVLFEKDPAKAQLLAITRNKLYKQTTENFKKLCKPNLQRTTLYRQLLRKPCHRNNCIIRVVHYGLKADHKSSRILL